MRMLFSRRSTLCAFAIVLLGILILEAGGNRIKRMAGGVPARMIEENYTAGIYLGKSSENPGIWLCGGAIISEYHILTAACCLSKFSPTELSVVVGTKDFMHNTNQQVHLVQKLIVHPDYNASLMLENNIGLILLEEPVSQKLIDQTLRQVYLPYYQVQANERSLLFGDDSLNHLELDEMEEWLVIIKNCRLPETTSLETKSKFICAENGFASTCMDDIGGPLVHDGYVIGIVSVGNCLLGAPTTYTNVYSYSAWIFNEISKKYIENHE